MLHVTVIDNESLSSRVTIIMQCSVNVASVVIMLTWLRVLIGNFI